MTEPPGFAMLNLTRLHVGIAHESQFQGLGISDCLVGEPITPNAAARSAAFALRANVGNVRDIFLDGFVRPHRQDPRSIQPLLALLARNIRQAGFFLRRCGGVDVFVLGVRRSGSCMTPR